MYVVRIAALKDCIDESSGKSKPEPSVEPQAATGQESVSGSVDLQSQPSAAVGRSQAVPKSAVEPETTVESESLLEPKSVVGTESIAESKSPSKLSESPVVPRSVIELQLLADPQPPSETKSPDEVQPQAEIQSAKILVVEEQPVRSEEKVANGETVTTQMLTSLNANNDLIRKLEESIMAVEEKFAERNVALLDDIKALHVEVHNKEKDRLKMHISQLQSSVNQKSSEINLLKQETNSGHCSKCISASDLVTKLQKEVDDLKSLLRCKEDCIDKLTAEAEILTRKNNDLMDTHGILLPQLEKGSALT